MTRSPHADCTKKLRALTAWLIATSLGVSTTMCGGDSDSSGGGGAGGSGGDASVDGSGGSSGSSGSSGSAGSSGTAGAGGTAGSGGSAGSAGTGGSAGSAGTGGTAGSAGTGGTAGSAATGGAGGSAGTAGSGGNSGSGGTAGGSAMAKCATENLVTNGSFQSDVASWALAFPGPDSALFSFVDADSAGASGSLLFTTGRPLGQLSVMSQCIPATMNTTYEGFAVSMLAPDVGSTGDVQLRLAFYAQANCGGAFQQIDRSALVALEGSWEDHSVTATAPGNAVSMLVALDQFRRTGGTIANRWDNICVVEQ